jgi:hypothetical protein
MPPGDPVPRSELDDFGIERQKAFAIFSAPSGSGSSSSSPALAQ